MWVVQADGETLLEFDSEEEAHDCAAAWNFAYPPPDYVEFTVVQVADGQT
jgi:hypothetical protein